MNLTYNKIKIGLYYHNTRHPVSVLKAFTQIKGHSTFDHVDIKLKYN